MSASRNIAVVASGPSLTDFQVRSICGRPVDVVAVSDSMRLIERYGFGDDAMCDVIAHISSDVRWWNQWQGRDHHTRVRAQTLDGPFTGQGTHPQAFNANALYQRLSRFTNGRGGTPDGRVLCSGALGLLYAFYRLLSDPRQDGGIIELWGHDLTFGSPGEAHFFGNHTSPGLSNPSMKDFELFSAQYQGIANLIEASPLFGKVSVLNCSQYSALRVFPRYY